VLTLLGFAMVITFMVLIMTRRLLPVVALVVIPILFALIGGSAPVDLGKMMIDGIKAIAPTGVMLTFAILYFGIMTDAGLFDPIVRRILAAVRGDPLRVIMGTAALALFVSLDGDGSTTYMITVAAMLPLYDRLRIGALNLACVTMLAGGVMNMTPWGGPLARAAPALKVDPNEIFIPMLPAMGVGVLAVLAFAWILGLRERRRLGVLSWQGANAATNAAAREGVEAVEHLVEPVVAELRRPRLMWVNALLTIALMTCLILNVLPLSALFMMAFAIALTLNYRTLEDQRGRIAAHAANALAVVSVIFAAGVFTGILSGTGMVEAMSKSFLAVLPPSWGPYLAAITALASLPFTFFISNDAFYFGVLPVLGEAASAYGITAAEMARASLIGQPVHLLSPLVPSTYLLVSLARVDFGDHQRFTLLWATLVCLAMFCASLILGIFPLAR
jgi:CitMHS family citrate-Mg2+:H+ or citrate-Ca2+:H+ symporter